MSAACLACLDPLEGGSTYHAKCLRRLFGNSKVPEIGIDLAKLHTLALAMVGHTSISGIQRKVSISLAADGRRLQVATEGGRYLLKPQSQTYPSLPENEHVTMQIARRLRIVIPECGLIKLHDGTLAYIAKRFDRLYPVGKLLQEDFCQLAERSPKQKYEGSSELCARLLLRFASEPMVETLRLYRLLIFVWWTGNGDMHLKNFSMLRGEDGIYRLSPAYDLLCTRLVVPDDLLALSVDGNKKNVTRRQWLSLGDACHIPRRAAERVLGEISAGAQVAEDLIGRSFLPGEMKSQYVDMLQERSALIRPRGT